MNLVLFSILKKNSATNSTIEIGTKKKKGRIIKALKRKKQNAKDTLNKSNRNPRRYQNQGHRSSSVHRSIVIGSRIGNQRDLKNRIALSFKTKSDVKVKLLSSVCEYILVASAIRKPIAHDSVNICINISKRREQKKEKKKKKLDANRWSVKNCRVKFSINKRLKKKIQKKDERRINLKIK